MRKVMALSLAAALSAALAACGGDDGEQSGGGNVTLWMYPVISDQAKSQAFWAKVEKDFEAANAGIDAKIELQPWDGRQEKVTTALAAGKGFDLVVLGPDQIPQYVQQGTLAPVDDVLADKSAFGKSALDALSVNGKLYGVPIYHTATLPVYNRAALAKAGITDVPDTWAEIKDAAPKLAASGVSVLNYAGAPNETLNLTFYPLLWQNGGSVFGSDGKSVAFNQPAGVQALQFLLDLAAVGGLQQGAATSTSSLEGSAFTQGKAAVLPTVQLSQLSQIEKAIGAENVVVGQPIEGKRRVSFGLPGGVVLGKHAAGNAAAKKLAAYLATPEVMAGLAKESGFFPTRSDVQVPDASENAKKFAAAIDKLYPGDTHPKARQVMSVLAPHIQAALQGKKSAQQALDDAAKEANALLGG
ncbi:ABC transporter substrate-binding protein [Allorhizocola rhizosphaerae]|uniref:ABC transporter substrate-binding protein n=1 Tax=Allorhizocola rhizosphaerae TaxID=1872709 RepID=UPI0013C2EACB|nr:extracellular solute-binding protein [Allorhizocola rhizosphaerae]